MTFGKVSLDNRFRDVIQYPKFKPRMHAGMTAGGMKSLSECGVRASGVHNPTCRRGVVLG